MVKRGIRTCVSVFLRHLMFRVFGIIHTAAGRYNSGEYVPRPSVLLASIVDHGE